MTPTPRNPKSYNKTLDLSPRAASMLLLPIQAKGYELLDAGGALIGSIDHFGDNALDASFAAFVAGLVNEALTRAAPVVTIEPETTTELTQFVTNEIEAAEWPGVPMCADPECLNGADPTSRGGYCMQHTVARWSAEDILRREG